MANDLGFRLDFDRSEIGEDEVGKLVSAVQQAVDPYGTVTLANNATYSVGTSVDMLVLDIGNGGTVTEDESIRVLLDSTVSNNNKMEILRALLDIALQYTIDTIDFTDEGSYADGNGTFETELTIT